MDSTNTVANEKRLNGFLESNREELLLNPWLGVGYIPGDLNTSDGMTKSMTSVNLRNLLAGNTFQIVTEEMKDKIRKKLPAAKHYIVYPETVQGKKKKSEPNDSEENKIKRAVANGRVFLKTKRFN